MEKFHQKTKPKLISLGILVGYYLKWFVDALSVHQVHLNCKNLNYKKTKCRKCSSEMKKNRHFYVQICTATKPLINIKWWVPEHCDYSKFQYICKSDTKGFDTLQLSLGILSGMYETLVYTFLSPIIFELKKAYEL